MTFSRVATPQGRLFTNQILVVPLHGKVLGHVLIIGSTSVSQCRYSRNSNIIADAAAEGPSGPGLEGHQLAAEKHWTKLRLLAGNLSLLSAARRAAPTKGSNDLRHRRDQ